MSDPSSNSNLDSILTELVSLVEEEREALLRLDSDSIEKLTERKSLLGAMLAQHHDELDASHKSQLETLRAALRHNLVLMVHARDHVQGTLGIITGKPGHPTSYHPTIEPVRLDLRG